MFLRLTPLDTLFFRSGRPFSAGIDTWVDLVFPPSPSTFYGALRSFLIFEGGTLQQFYDGNHKHTKWIGKKSTSGKADYGDLQIRGIFFLKDCVYFPAPLDLVSVKNKDKNRLIPLRFQDKPQIFISNYPLQNILLWQGKELVKETEGLLTLEDLIDYLKNRKKDFSPIKTNKLFQYEYKIGIARDRTTFTSKEGHLYRVPMVRLNKTKDNKTYFLVETSDIEGFPQESIMQLGGEGKAVRFEKIENDPLGSIKNIDFNFKNKYFKIYFATPSVFKNGWKPSWINENYEGEYEGIKLRLVACTIGRPISIGGWDLLGETSKPMRKAIPAGSVYYFKILDDAEPKKIKEVFHFKNISDNFDDIKYSKEGFGLAILGRCEV